MADSMNLNIYSYKSGRAFLKDAFGEKKKANAAFSLRSWARRLDLKSHAPLQLMLAGKRPIPKPLANALAKDCGLNVNESLFFETLLLYEDAKDIESKNHYYSRLGGLVPESDYHTFELDQFEILQNPLHGLLLEMSDLPGFKADSAWISERILIKASNDQIQTALQRLIALGFFVVNEKGGVTKRHPNLWSRNDVEDLALQRFHRNVLSFAAKQLSVQHVLQREFLSYAFNLKRKDIEPAKLEIRRFIKDFLSRFEAAPGTGDETYQINLQLFAMSANYQMPVEAASLARTIKDESNEVSA